MRFPMKYLEFEVEIHDSVPDLPKIAENDGPQQTGNFSITMFVCWNVGIGR